MSQACRKLGIIRFGLAVGLAWGLGMFILGLMVTYWSWGDDLLKVFASLYPGYQGTLEGSIVGGLWALADGFVFGVLIAFFYNLFGIGSSSD